MRHEGPALAALTRRLAECPPDFRGLPRGSGESTGVVFPAVVHDLVMLLRGPDIVPEPHSRFRGHPPDDLLGRRALQIPMVACWLFADPWFVDQGERFIQPILHFLSRDFRPLVEALPPHVFTTDPDRREELVRLALAALDLRPAGETEAQARDRLSSLDSVERAALIAEARAAEIQRRRVAEEMARKRAQEAAATYGRE
jgi:hypothetical protein